MGKGKPSKSAEGKLVYQAPKLISLGEPDTGFGQQCMFGSAARAGNCHNGAGPGAHCTSGSIGTDKCNNGTGGP